MRINNKKGQSTLEYAILVIIIIAALISLQTYVKRGVQGRLKSATDDIGEGFSTSTGGNYYKKTVTISNTIETLKNGLSTTEIQDGGGVMKTDTYTNIQMNTYGEYGGV
ncbi:MAG: hypothetical protein HQL22_06690 [Candidatus Omnitrophica bacterium]|nr:hypothetical protein [Candidatus Omnitrophota bacterium]